jgi:ketosteroid isomerase-like protein
MMAGVSAVRALLVGGAVLMLAACNNASHSPGVPPELKHSWEMAFNRGDSAAVAALYSEDAQLAMSGAAPVQGASAIRAAIDGMVKSNLKVRIGTERNVGNGDVAYVYGPYSVFDHDGDRLVESGSYVEVWRRHRGVWQIDLDVNAAGPLIAHVTQPQP